MRNAITLNWNNCLVGGLGLEEDDIVGNDAGADAGLALLICDLAVRNFTGHQSSLALLEVGLNRLAESWLEDDDSVPVCALNPITAFIPGKK